MATSISTNGHSDSARCLACTGEKPIIGPPSQPAGVRDVTIPPHLLPEFQRHLSDHVPSVLDRCSSRAPVALIDTWGRRRSIATSTGLATLLVVLICAGTIFATLARRWRQRLERRWQNSWPASGTPASPRAAMIYQHASSDRDRVIAEALSRMAELVSLRHRGGAEGRSAVKQLCPVTGPGIMRDAETNRRVRPSASRLKSIPRSRRTAEIICGRTGREPALVAIVTGSRDRGRVVPSGDINGGRVGQDLVAPCRCGLDHVIDGGRLRSALLALQRARDAYRHRERRALRCWH